uniref:Fibronectin type-III domain-containing protein n=1 Tax=Denticeps clupeoides TaxID=299321 RepID=A0AAY4E8Z7_9TELE
MPVIVQNVTATSAVVSWPSSPGCIDTFYSVMYHPNWNSLLMGYTRKSFLREDRVPVSQTTSLLSNLSPQTTYIICVTCQSANPSRDQCQVFNTLDESSEMGSGRWELAMGVWLASSLLLLVIAVVLLCGCLHSLCPRWSHPVARGCPATSNPSQVHASRAGEGADSGRGSVYTPSCSDDDSQQAAALENPFRFFPFQKTEK